MMLGPDQALTVDYRSEAWNRPPYNGATALRSDFDSWLAGHAEAAGATVVCSTTVTAVLRDGTGRVVGVRTDRPDGEITARVVIACDGVNSFVAKDAGLYPEPDPANFTLGVKEVLALPRPDIDRRFGLSGRAGADFEIIGGTGDVPGGGFLYTNLDSVAVGVVLHLPALTAQSARPEEIIARLKAHPAIAPLVEGGELAEYSAHLIPEGGYDAMPELVGDGVLVAGDAAGLCLAAGIWLEGVNYAIGSGMAAGATAASALARGDTSAAALAPYRARLESSFVLGDHRKLRHVPHFVLSERVQRRYPELACRLAERVFRVDNPSPKPGLSHILREELRRAGVRTRDLSRDALTVWRSFG
jgi:electron transfer flavoprotein-quinone oxidoreductase